MNHKEIRIRAPVINVVKVDGKACISNITQVDIILREDHVQVSYDVIPLGITGNDSDIIQKAIDLVHNLRLDRGVYIIDKPITIKGRAYIFGEREDKT